MNALCTSHLQPLPPPPGNSGDFDFRPSKSLVKPPPCGDNGMVKSPVKAPALQGHQKIKYNPPLLWGKIKTTAVAPQGRDSQKVKTRLFSPAVAGTPPGVGAVVTND